MNRSVAAILVTLAAVLSGCEDEILFDCTQQFEYGLGVETRERGTGAAVLGATLIVRDGIYLEVSGPSVPRTLTDSAFRSAHPVLSAAGERPGRYDLTVRHPDYHVWEVQDVVVTADECHVIPVRLTALLERLP
jgi:hypothetical protein